jgi:hypothetical protein
VWPGSSRDTRTFPSLVFKLYIEQILSKPPHATKLPDGAYAHVMTHDERNGMACTYKLIEKVLEKRCLYNKAFGGRCARCFFFPGVMRQASPPN